MTLSLSLSLSRERVIVAVSMSLPWRHIIYSWINRLNENARRLLPRDLRVDAFQNALTLANLTRDALGDIAQALDDIWQVKVSLRRHVRPFKLTHSLGQLGEAAQASRQNIQRLTSYTEETSERVVDSTVAAKIARPCHMPQLF